jgi:hypothetical protein
MVMRKRTAHRGAAMKKLIALAPVASALAAFAFAAAITVLTVHLHPAMACESSRCSTTAIIPMQGEVVPR